MKKDLISIPEIKIAAQVLRALNHRLRQEIVYLLHANKKLTVTDIYTKLRIDQTVASGQLAILRAQGIVKVERAAKQRYYYIDYKRLQDVNVMAKCLALSLP